MLQRNRSKNKIASGIPKRKKRPEWNDAITDLSVYKASSQELERKRLICKSKHAETAKIELMKKSLLKPRKFGNLDGQVSTLKELLFESDKLLEVFDGPEMNSCERNTNFKKQKGYASTPVITPAPKLYCPPSGERRRHSTGSPIDKLLGSGHIYHENESDTTKSSPSIPRNDSQNDGSRLGNFVEVLTNLIRTLNDMESNYNCINGSVNDASKDRPSQPSCGAVSVTEYLLSTMCRLLFFIHKLTSELDKEHDMRKNLRCEVEHQGILLDEITMEIVELKKLKSRLVLVEDQITKSSTKATMNLSCSDNINVNGNLGNSKSGPEKSSVCLKCVSPPDLIAETLFGKVAKGSLSTPDFRLTTLLPKDGCFDKATTSHFQCNISGENLRLRPIVVNKYNERLSIPLLIPIKTSENSSQQAGLRGQDVKLEKEADTLDCQQTQLHELHSSESFQAFSTSGLPIFHLDNETSESLRSGFPCQTALMLTHPQQCDMSGIDDGASKSELSSISPSFSEECHDEHALPSSIVALNEKDKSAMQQLSGLKSSGESCHLEKRQAGLQEPKEVSTKLLIKAQSTNMVINSADLHPNCCPDDGVRQVLTTPASGEQDVLSQESFSALSETDFNKASNVGSSVGRAQNSGKQLDIEALLSKLEALQTQFVSSQVALKTMQLNSSSQDKLDNNDEFLSPRKLGLVDSISC